MRIQSDVAPLLPADVKSYHLLVQHVHQSAWCGNHDVDTPTNTRTVVTFEVDTAVAVKMAFFCAVA
jgi:hypothetical protein